MGRRPLFVILLACNLLIGSGLAQETAQPQKEYVIQKGDYLLFEKFAGQIPCLWVPARVRDNGKFTLPLAGDIQAAGKTPAQLTADIETAIVKYVSRTDVSLRVRDKNGVEHR